VSGDDFVRVFFSSFKKKETKKTKTGSSLILKYERNGKKWLIIQLIAVYK
jgi:hypothetical protein